jgi:hypothetical protein
MKVLVEKLNYSPKSMTYHLAKGASFTLQKSVKKGEFFNEDGFPFYSWERGFRIQPN